MKMWIPLVVLVALSGACRFNDQQTKLQYMPDMADAPTVKSQESYLDSPEGAVAMEDEIYPETAEEAEASMTMPASFAQDSERFAKGEKLWMTFCVM